MPRACLFSCLSEHLGVKELIKSKLPAVFLLGPRCCNFLYHEHSLGLHRHTVARVHRLRGPCSDLETCRASVGDSTTQVTPREPEGWPPSGPEFCKCGLAQRSASRTLPPHCSRSRPGESLASEGLEVLAAFYLLSYSSSFCQDLLFDLMSKSAGAARIQERGRSLELTIILPSEAP